MKPSAALIVRRTALNPPYGFWAAERHIVVGSTSDAACPEKAHYVRRHVPKRLFYIAVAEPGTAFIVCPRRYDAAFHHRDEVRVYIYVDFFRVERTGRLSLLSADWAAGDIARWTQDARESHAGKRASPQATLVRLTAVRRYAQAGYERMEKAASAIAVAETPFRVRREA